MRFGMTIVKTGKVKGFSIEGFFADKIEAQKMKKEEQEADLLLSKNHKHSKR